MNATRLYMIIGAVLVAILVVVILLPTDETAPTQEAAQGQMPPGHPDVNDPNAPSKDNVIGSFMEEFERLGKKIEAQPATDTTDVLAYARMCLDAHQAATALPLLERYSKAAPKNVHVLLDLSVAQFETGKTDAAEATTRQVLRIDPRNTRAMYNLGALAASLERKDEARRHWEELIKNHPDSPDAERAKQFLQDL